jgi:1,4-dihydroxy-6-naphthoate synthase
MKIAFSPCPNDTFVFHAWVHDLIPDAPKLDLEDVRYADIDITNGLAADSGSSGLDVMKISFAALPYVSSDYMLLPCGGALGRGCGPLVLSGRDSRTGEPMIQDAAALSGKRIAVPSERSTAYLLFRLWTAQRVPNDAPEIVVMPFDQIMPALRDGQIDAGLVIHEARFTYPSYGLSLLDDLGEWWEADTGLPIPLGAIIARRTLDVKAIARAIKASVEYAWAQPDASSAYVLEHAQEMDPEVASQHIALYVNEFTADLGDSGYHAITSLLGRAASRGLLPEVKPEVLALGLFKE